jgi:hypothetical protein
MPNHMKFCGCQACKRGMHMGSRMGAVVRKMVRRFRREAKSALRRGLEPERIIGVPYTD